MIFPRVEKLSGFNPSFMNFIITTAVWFSEVPCWVRLFFDILCVRIPTAFSEMNSFVPYRALPLGFDLSTIVLLRLDLTTLPCSKHPSRLLLSCSTVLNLHGDNAAHPFPVPVSSLHQELARLIWAFWLALPVPGMVPWIGWTIHQPLYNESILST